MLYKIAVKINNHAIFAAVSSEKTSKRDFREDKARMEINRQILKIIYWKQFFAGSFRLFAGLVRRLPF